MKRNSPRRLEKETNRGKSRLFLIVIAAVTAVIVFGVAAVWILCSGVILQNDTLYTEDSSDDVSLEENSPDVSNAMLYAITDGALEYNMTHTDVIGPDVQIIDQANAQISTLEELSATLSELEYDLVADLFFDSNGEIVSICLTEYFARPIVGIAWESEDQDHVWYTELLTRNGATAVDIPRVTDTQSAKDALAQVDGIMLPGGGDIDPEYYGDENTYSRGIDPERDASDYYLIQQAIAMDVPMLAICRGCQVMNVACGGGLIQDIPAYLEEQGLPSAEETGVNHMGGTLYHELDFIDKNSKWLYTILGSDTWSEAASYHHQAVDPSRLGEGLTIVASSPDGIVEAIEYQDNLFSLGVQFHPERDARRDTEGVDVDQDTCNRFFRALIEYSHLYAINTDISEEESGNG